MVAATTMTFILLEALSMKYWIPLYDSKSKGCGDGLGAEGISANQGAESTISFLLGLLTMLEGHNS